MRQQSNNILVVIFVLCRKQSTVIGVAGVAGRHVRSPVEPEHRYLPGHAKDLNLHMGDVTVLGIARGFRNVVWYHVQVGFLYHP